MTFTTEFYEDLSRRLFLALCGKVKGRVFTRANADTDSIYVSIKKGTVLFECGVFDISHYNKYYAQINLEHMTDWMCKKVIGTYKHFLNDRFFKNQPTLTLHIPNDPFRIDAVKEDSSNDIYSEVSAGSDSRQSI